MTKKVNRWLRSKAGTRAIAAILVVLVVVLVAGFVFGWWSALSESLSGSAGGFWKGVPNTADGCVTTYEMKDGSGPLGRVCFRSTKLNPGFYNCEGNICYIQQLTEGKWLRTDEVVVTP